MILIHYLLTAVCILALTSCSFIKKPKEASQERVLWDVGPAQELSEYEQIGRVLNQELLLNNFNILVLPFKPAEDVEYNDQMDATAFMIVRGVVDVFESCNNGEHTFEVCLKGDKDRIGKYNLIVSNEKHEADLIVEGYITQLSNKSFMRIPFRKGINNLTVTGKMAEKETGAIVVSFNNQMTKKASEKDFSELGRMIGQNIGQFIVHHINKGHQ